MPGIPLTYLLITMYYSRHYLCAIVLQSVSQICHVFTLFYRAVRTVSNIGPIPTRILDTYFQFTFNSSDITLKLLQRFDYRSRGSAVVLFVFFFYQPTYNYNNLELSICKVPIYYIALLLFNFHQVYFGRHITNISTIISFCFFFAFLGEKYIIFFRKVFL